MKHPTLNAASVSNATVNGETNSIQITFVDTINNTQVINLSPQAQESLLLALIARPSVGLLSEQKVSRRPLGVIGARRIQDAKGFVGLELVVGDNQAIHVMFPPEGVAPFQKMVAAIHDPSSWDNSVAH